MKYATCSGSIFEQEIVFGSLRHVGTSCEVRLNPGNSNCQGKLQLLRVIYIGVSSYRGFEKDQKDLIKVILCLYTFYRKISSNVRA